MAQGHIAKGNKNILKQRSQGTLFISVLKLKTNLSNHNHPSLLDVNGPIFWHSDLEIKHPEPERYKN